MDIEGKYREITLFVSGREFEKAQKTILEVLDHDPQDAMALGYSGVIKVVGGELVEGAMLLKQSNERFEAGLHSETEEWIRDVWRQRRSNMGQAIFHLIGGEEARVMEISRLIINEAGMNHERALKSLAVEAIHAGDFAAAVAFLKRALEEQPRYASGWYNLGCTYAKLSMKSEMIEALKNAIEFGQSDCAMDYRPEIREDDDFEPYRLDADFIELVETLPKDPALRKLYRTLQSEELDQVLKMGEEIRANASDQLAVLEAMHEAARLAADDLDEHGKLHRAKYQFDEPYYVDLKKKLKSEIGDLKRSGAQSRVFKVFSGD